MRQVIRTLVIIALLAVTGVASGQGLSVTNLSPASNALTAPVTTSITVTFDRAIDPASITTASFWAFGRWSGSAEGTLSFAPSGNTVTLTPTDPFSAGETVMVILSEAVTALDGTDLAPGGYSFLFWTAAAPASLQFTLIQEFSTRTAPGQVTRSYGGVGSDMNNDGHLDFAVINEISEDLRVYLNLADGTGTLGPMVVPPAPLGEQGSPNEPSDFDRDGNTDLVVANAVSNTISVLLGNGDGTFQALPEIPVGPTPLGITVLDVNGDGSIDLANTNTGNGTVSVLLNDGTGHFGPPTFFDPGGSAERAIAAADMNEDGRLDLVVGAISSGQIIVLTSNGDGTFTVTDSEPGVGGTWMLALGDLNGDGHVDVTSGNSGANTGSVNLGGGDGTVAAPSYIATDPSAIATDVGDLDGDGDLDWMISSFSGDWGLWINDGLGNFTFGQEFPAPSAASCATIMDIDGDGDLDLALVDELADVVIIYRNGAPAPPTEFIRADANGDGMTDLADAISMLAVLFQGQGPPGCEDANDANDDGGGDISDPVYLLAYLFSLGMNPPAPFSGCGVDPTADGLDCGNSPACP